MPGTRPGIWLESMLGGLLEVIGRSHVGGAFHRSARGNRCKQRRVVIRAEFIVPVAVADIEVQDSRLAPPQVGRVKDQTVVFEDFGFAEGVEGIRSRACAGAERVQMGLRNTGAFREVNARETAPRDRPRQERQRLGYQELKPRNPLKLAVATGLYPDRPEDCVVP